MKRKFHHILIFHFCLSISAFSQTVTFPINDISDNRQNLVAFKNATIFTDHINKIENGILLIKGDRILQVGAGIQIPNGATVIDLKGKFIYPSFIETDSDYGMPELKRTQGRGYYNFDNDSKKKGAYAWNQSIQPENDASNLFVINSKTGNELRKLGFGAVITYTHDGIARGTSALVALVDDKEQNALLKSKVSAHYSFSKGASTQSYPSSMMGSVALLRQTYYDAQWCKNQKNNTEFNLSLDAFNSEQSIPQVFEALDKSGILRADKIGDEFNKQYIMLAGGDEYQRLDEIKATGAPLILTLNFPSGYDVDDPFDAKAISLAELKHWEMAPYNPSMVAKAGIEFALSSAANKNKADFIANLKKSIENGLSESEALKALTTTPAKLYNIAELVGAIKPGLLANFLITSGNIFGKENIIFENWVKGIKNIYAEKLPTDLRGKYKAQFGEENFMLNITGKAESLEFGIILNDTIKISPKIVRNADFLTIKYVSKKGQTSENRISAFIENGGLKGKGETSEGIEKVFLATCIEPFKEPIPKPDSIKAIPILGKLTYPFGAFGLENKAISENFIIKNATVWTNEKEGIIANTDVLVENGKIQKIGKNLTNKSNKIIDGTGKHLTNGIIDEHSHIALSSINEGGQSVTAEVRTADVLDAEDIDIYRQLAGGTTSAQLLHGSANSIGGQSSLIKFKWGEAANGLLIQNADAFIKFALGENVTRKGGQSAGGNAPRYPLSRMGVEQVMMDAFTKAKAYDESWKKYNASNLKESSLMPRKDLELEALAQIINKKRFITCHSYVQSEINMMMKVAEAFNFKINTFTHILEGYKVAELMAKHGAGGSTFSDWWAYKMEVRDAIPYNAALMHKAGVTVAINSDDAEMARRLNQEAAKTMLYGGLSEEEAWKTVTLNPAKLLHLDNRMGSIKVGKDADLVLWNNNPLSIYARPEKSIIEGAVYFDIDTDIILQENVKKERARIIQKMIAAKAAGAPIQKANGPKTSILTCEDERSGF